MMKSYLPMMQERVAIYQKKSVSDDCGGFTETWHQLHFVWAAIRLATTRTYSQSQSTGQRLGSAEAKDALYEVVLRREVKIEAGMRLHWAQKILVVVSDPVRQVNKQFHIVFASLLKPSEGGPHV
jgi:head-tail adaptor